MVLYALLLEIDILKFFHHSTKAIETLELMLCQRKLYTLEEVLINIF